LTRSRPQQAAYRFQQSALSMPVGPDNQEKIALINFKANVSDGMKLAVIGIDVF
jgi:hypothetical protein